MKEVVSFFLSNQKYGVEMKYMQGIERYREMTRPSGMPECLLGIVEIRNEKIPVVDMKARLFLPPTEVTENTKYLIFLTVHGKLACLVDGISQILKAGGEDLQEVPEYMHRKATEYMDFIARNGNDLVIAINPEHFLEDGDWKKISEMLDEMSHGGTTDDVNMKEKVEEDDD